VRSIRFLEEPYCTGKIKSFCISIYGGLKSFRLFLSIILRKVYFLGEVAIPPPPPRGQPSRLLLFYTILCERIAQNNSGGFLATTQ